MAASTTRLPISIEEANGSSLATVVNPGALPVEVLEPIEIAAGQSVNVGTVTTLPAITVAGSQVIGIDTAANTVKLSQTASQNGVDLVKVGGNAISGSSVPVTLSTPGTEKYSYQTSAGVSANLGAATLTFTAITGGTIGKFLKAMFSSQTQMKIELQTFDGSTAVTFAVIHLPAGGGDTEFIVPNEDFITFAGGATNRFRALVTNLDKSKVADIFGTCFWTEV